MSDLTITDAYFPRVVVDGLTQVHADYARWDATDAEEPPRAREEQDRHLAFRRTPCSLTPEPAALRAMAGTGVKVRVRVPREDVLDLEVVGGYRYGAKVMVVYRHGGTTTGGRFVFRLRHARGVQLWEGDESHHLLAADIARFDALAPGSKFVLGRIPWTKMSESDLRRSPRQRRPTQQAVAGWPHERCSVRPITAAPVRVHTPINTVVLTGASSRTEKPRGSGQSERYELVIRALSALAPGSLRNRETHARP